MQYVYMCSKKGAGKCRTFFISCSIFILTGYIRLFLCIQNILYCPIFYIIRRYPGIPRVNIRFISHI